MTLIHPDGTTKSVSFSGIYGTNFDQAYIRWQEAGQYRVNLDTGYLSIKKANAWRVSISDLERMRATAKAELAEAKQRIKSRRSSA